MKQRSTTTPATGSRRSSWLALIWLLSILVVGCAAAHQAYFAATYATCSGNPAACRQRCQADPTDAECEVLAVQLGEQLATQGNVDNLGPSVLQGLHAQLAGLCSRGIERACAADQPLGSVIVNATADLHAKVQAAEGQANTETLAIAAEKTRALAEDAATKEAQGQCEAHPDTCKSKCDAGDQPFCVAWAIRAWRGTPPKLVEAQRVMAAACGSGSRLACTLSDQIATEIQVAAGRVDDLWAKVEEGGDAAITENDLADYVIHTLPFVHNVAQGQRAAEKARKVAAAIVTEKYCPARSAFLAESSQQEFTKRATEHCAQNPPASKDSSVTNMKGQCTKTYQTTACPAAPPKTAPPTPDAVNSSPAWQAVQQIGDRFANGRFVAAQGVYIDPSARNVRNAEIVANLEAKEVKEEYCPAKRAFLAQFSLAQFRKAATGHCQGDPPKADGLSGAKVPLSRECTAVYATSCP